MEEMLTVKEVSQLLKVATITVNRLVKQGMPSYKFGRSRRFKATEIDEWLKNSDQPKQQPKPKPAKEAGIHKDLLTAIEHWNNQPRMIKCKEPTAKLNTVFSRLYKIYGLEEMLATITRYAVVVDDEQYFFNTRWNMETFLRQGNAFPDFTCDGQKWINYTEKTAKQDESHEKVDIWM